jgi:LPXTG-site transpeptidase (sortase) family protein
MGAKRKQQRPNTASILIWVGSGLLGTGLLLFVAIFRTVLWEEIQFWLVTQQTEVAVAGVDTQSSDQTEADAVIEPVNTDFSVVIPRLRANAPVVADVDPFNAAEYQVALSKGVAHAHSTAYPDEAGNIFLFAHSAGNFYEANRYNSVFYLLNKLTVDDEIILFFEGEPYRYQVTETKLVSPDEVSYLEGNAEGDTKTLTLMTCWPAGTTLERLLVFAEAAE